MKIITDVLRVSNKLKTLWKLCDTPNQYFAIIQSATQYENKEAILDSHIFNLTNMKR